MHSRHRHFEWQTKGWSDEANVFIDAAAEHCEPDVLTALNKLNKAVS
jgi:hypothetical protein